MRSSAKLRIVDSLAAPVGAYWHELQARIAGTRPFAVAAPLSSTPLPVYDWLISQARASQRWDNVVFVLMDEQVEGGEPPFGYVPTEDPASYEGFARRHLLEPLEAKLAIEIPLVKPELPTIGGFTHDIDLLVLALGVRGNYANVMPGTPLETGWHIAHLIPEFRQAHTGAGSQSYEGAAFREYGMSLGPQQVLSAGEVVVIVSGSRKHDLTEQLLSYDDFDAAFPLSVIHHEDVASRVTVFVTGDVGVSAR